MAINKLYFSHVNYKFEKHTELLNSSNINKVLSSEKLSNYHTSVNDLKFENVQKAIKSAKEIILVDLDILNNPIKDNDYYVYGRLLNELYTEKHKVKNLDFISNMDHNFFNDTVASRPDVEKVLWTVGCSVTHGSGVTYKERYGSILSEMLNLPEVSLSMPGHSNEWGADQLLRSDVRAGDYVVWGITDISRIEFAKDWQLYAAPVTSYLKLPIDLQHYNLNYFDSQVKFLKTFKTILQVKNYCEKIGAHLILANLIDSTYCKFVFSKLPNYIDFCYELDEELLFIDLGSDNIHPGPKQHRHYAEQIFKLIKENNYG